MANGTQPTLQEIGDELDRLLEDAAFRRAPSHSRLLRYLVERKAAGDDSALCEAGIAMAVFQRDPAAYDAEIDPIVRVSIGRLRDRLEKHYQRFDRVPETTITLPRGRYAPEFRRRPSGAPGPTVLGLVVLPTRNLTGDIKYDGPAQSLGERLSEALALMGIPRVIAQGSVQQSQIKTQSPVEIALQLRVSEIIETTLSLEASQRLRISARLIKVADEELAWAEVRVTAQVDPYPGIDALFDAVLARFVANSGVNPKVSKGRAGYTKMLLPAEARGKIDSARMLITHLSVASIDQARTLLAEVTSEFPDAVDAWALRGRTCVRRLNYADLSAPPLFAELQECVGRALALNSDHIDALALRALISHWTAALPDAEIQFRDVLRAAPNHTSARLGFAWLLLAQGRFDEAMTALDAASSYDPMSLNVLFNRAFVLSASRRHEEARTLFETGIRAGGESVFSLSASARNEFWAGELECAEALYLRIGKLTPTSASSTYGLACIAALRGNDKQARALRQSARESGLALTTNHHLEAELNSALGDRAATLADLRQAFTAMEGWRLLLGINLAFEWLADDADFMVLLGALGLKRWSGVRREVSA